MDDKQVIARMILVLDALIYGANTARAAVLFEPLAQIVNQAPKNSPAAPTVADAQKI